MTTRSVFLSGLCDRELGTLCDGCHQHFLSGLCDRERANV